MENWLRGLLEHVIDTIFDEEGVAEMKRQASHLMVEGADEQNLCLGYVNGFVSGYADSAIVLMCREDPVAEELDGVRDGLMRRSEEMLRHLGIV